MSKVQFTPQERIRDIDYTLNRLEKELEKAQEIIANHVPEIKRLVKIRLELDKQILADKTSKQQSEKEI